MTKIRYYAARQVILLIALPMCLAQFRIQGASDGSRAAESLSVDSEGKVEYSGHRGASDSHSNIQGASDSYSNVQAGSDGHSNYNIQPATAAGADRYIHPAPPPAYNIQGATDGHSVIQGSYDGNPSTKSLQYNDPSGLRVNWRSYDRAVRPSSQSQPQYSEVQASAPRVAPQRQRAHARPQQAAQPQPQAQSYEPILPPAQPYENAPADIKQLFQFQKMLPYLNIIPEPFRYENIIGAQQQQPQYPAEEQQQYVPEPRRPPSRGKARIPSRQKRQAQGHRQAPQQPPPEPQLHYSTRLPPELQQILKFQQQTPHINGIPEQFRFNTDVAVREQLEAVRAHFRDLSASPQRYAPKSRQRRQAHPQQQPAPEPQLQYSNNHPGYVKDLLKFQSQIPYTILPNLVGITRPEKPYVPQRVQSPAPAPDPAPAPQPQYQGQAYQGQANAYQNQPAQYQPQPSAYQNPGDAYQGQPSSYNQVYQSDIQYPQYSQGQPGYQQRGETGVRPVTENQY
ncbi:uncharacterized protein LOC116427795 [Nomia melanderi]|uniref:uncharacterized protein LOC116427795 n=1 Tax=Nomia melanderi TaxID=2448451 RepID=UPI003FCCBB67